MKLEDVLRIAKLNDTRKRLHRMMMSAREGDASIKVGGEDVMYDSPVQKAACETMESVLRDEHDKIVKMMTELGAEFE